MSARFGRSEILAAKYPEDLFGDDHSADSLKAVYRKLVQIWHISPWPTLDRSPLSGATTATRAI